VTWWLESLDEPEPDELGALEGDWSWSLLDELELLFEPDVELVPEPPELSLELDEELLVWPAYAAAAVADSTPVSASPLANAHRVSRETRCRPRARALMASSRMVTSLLRATEGVWAAQIGPPRECAGNPLRNSDQRPPRLMIPSGDTARPQRAP
jgi:hypothetical protein